MSSELISVAARASTAERLRQVVRGVVPTRAYASAAELLDIAYGMKAIGWSEFFRLRRMANAGASEPIQIKVSGLLHPVWIRPQTTDLIELVYSTVRETYGAYLPQGPVKLIVDAGANLGDTAAWYLSRYPEARLIAIEPHPDNFQILSRNLLPYGNRVTLVQAALWSQPGELQIQEAAHNAMSVTTGAGDGLTCQAITMSQLLQRYAASDQEVVDIFKCDIEGAERAVFSEGDLGWVGRLRSAAVEIHDAPSLQAVTEAFAKNGFRSAIHRNVHFFLK